MTCADVSEWSSTDLMSSYIDLSAELHEVAARCRCVADCRAVVRDAMIDRFGLDIAVRFMAHVEQSLPG